MNTSIANIYRADNPNIGIIDTNEAKNPDTDITDVEKTDKVDDPDIDITDVSMIDDPNIGIINIEEDPQRSLANEQVVKKCLTIWTSFYFFYKFCFFFFFSKLETSGYWVFTSSSLLSFVDIIVKQNKLFFK